MDEDNLQTMLHFQASCFPVQINQEHNLENDMKWFHATCSLNVILNEGFFCKLQKCSEWVPSILHETESKRLELYGIMLPSGSLNERKA